ncbi:barstar family protein [Moheibacter sediminis]|uniref:Barstar (Barnase inhibitor) n=1 Tax=Moheibacter sediminis TaxID=1434700 RepID=A0A1W2AZR4_9FLAO|nr:barstar family protein [Moheibacter sediminis]SMC66203.1 Barstar (barnase inhibitor) [Moheibacter sediminis]
MKKEFRLDGNNFDDLEGFYIEIYKLMTLYEDWKPAHNLDALNDMLYSGFGEEAILIWKNSEKSKLDLGSEATIDFYKNKVKHGKPFNITWAKEKLEELQSEKGQTLFEILIEIFTDHPNIDLILE